MRPRGTKETLRFTTNASLSIFRLIFINRSGLLNRVCSGDNLYTSVFPLSSGKSLVTEHSVLKKYMYMYVNGIFTYWSYFRFTLNFVTRWWHNIVIKLIKNSKLNYAAMLQLSTPRVHQWVCHYNSDFLQSCNEGFSNGLLMN